MPLPATPLPVGTWLVLGKALRDLARYDEALAAFDSAIGCARAADDRGLWLAYFEKGRTLLVQKRYPEAQATFEEAEQLAGIRGTNEHVFLRWGIATGHGRRGQHQTAHEAWCRMRVEFDRLPELARLPSTGCQQGQVLLDYFRDFQEAERVLQDARNDGHVDSLISRIDLHVERMDLPPASRTGDEAAQGQDWNMRAWSEVRTSFRSGDALLHPVLTSPFVRSKSRIRRNAQRQSAALRLALLKSPIGLTAPEKMALEKDLHVLVNAEANFPDRSGTAHAMLGVFYGLQERYVRAIPYFQGGLSTDFDNPDLRSSLAQCYHRQERLREARREYETALRYAPGHVESLMGLGEICLDESLGADGKITNEDLLEEACGYLDRCLNASRRQQGSRFLSEKEKAVLFYLRGYSRVKQWEADKFNTEKLSQALGDFNEACKRYPENQEYRRAYEKVQKKLPRRRDLRRNLPQTIVMVIGLIFLILAGVGRFVGFPSAAPTPTAQVLEKLVKQTVPDSLRGAYVQELKPLRTTDWNHRQPISASEFALLAFGGVLLFIAGAYLHQLVKLKVAGVELEKNVAPEVIANVGNVVLSRVVLSFQGNNLRSGGEWSGRAVGGKAESKSDPTSTSKQN